MAAVGQEYFFILPSHIGDGGLLEPSEGTKLLEMVIIYNRLRVLFFEPERKPSQDGTLVETESLSRIAKLSEDEGPKPALSSRTVLMNGTKLSKA
jgi:hypothetical protein